MGLDRRGQTTELVPRADDRDRAGLAAVHGSPAAGVALRLPLVHGGEPVGTLLIGARAHGEALGDGDRRLLEDFARHAAAAVSAIAPGRTSKQTEV